VTLQPGDQIDQFTILGPLGQGGTSASFLARDRVSGERVVLKFPSQSAASDPSEEARFRREAVIAQRLRHPNIQHAANAEIDRDAPYLALEYVDGRSLRAWLESDHPPSIDQAVELTLQIARGISYAHAHDVVHRDLKPENVVVLPDCSVKVIDFGSARMVGLRRLTFRVKGEASGTPDYMAPEQVEGGRGDARTDIYALGVMLYELLAGRVPFEGDNPQAVMYQQINAEPAPPSRYNPAVPAELDAVVLRALRKKPGARYQSAADFADDLDATCARTPATPAQFERGGKIARLTQRLRRT
jgi:eukaryotic-like serine/threonine-protein kinase